MKLLSLYYGYNIGVPVDYVGHIPLNQVLVEKDTRELRVAIEDRLNLKRINLDDIIFFKLKTSYPIELKTHVEGALRPRKYERGCGFYEFLYEEDISDAKEIIFVNVCDAQYHFCLV